MDHPKMPELVNDNPGYSVPMDIASTTNQHFFHFKSQQDAIPGVSSSHLNMLQSNLYPDKFKNASPLKLQPLVATQQRQLTTQDTYPSTEEEAFSVIQQFNSRGYNCHLSMETSEESCKNASSIQIPHGTDVNKRLRSEICGMHDQVISNSNEDCMNLDTRLNMDEVTDLILFDYARSAGNNLEIPNQKESLFRSQELQVPDYISNKQSCRSKRSSAFNMNISQIEDAASKMINPNNSKIINAYSADHMRAVPGPSFSQENIAQSYLCLEELENKSLSKLQPLVKTEQNQSMCLLCKEKSVYAHWEVYFGSKMYGCCQCRFRSKRSFFLFDHISDHHLLTFSCNACQIAYLDASSHAETCDICEEYFQCKYQFEDHYLKHEEFHKSNCRICREKIYKHFTIIERVTRYKCCFPKCKYENNNKFYFLSHLYTHSHLKLFKCKFCGNRYKRQSSLNLHERNDHPKCI